MCADPLSQTGRGCVTEVGGSDGDLSRTDDAGMVRAADRLRLSARLWEQVSTHLAAELPNEGVGLLAARLTQVDGEVVATATRFYPGRNQRASPTRYDLDVRDLVAALRDIEDSGDVLGGIVHSHPVGEPTPSRTDLAEANYPEALMLIVSFATSAPTLRGWKLEGEPGAWKPRQVPIDLD